MSLPTTGSGGICFPVIPSKVRPLSVRVLTSISRISALNEVRTSSKLNAEQTQSAATVCNLLSQLMLFCNQIKSHTACSHKARCFGC